MSRINNAEAIDVAQSIITQGKKKKINDITPLKLQKLLFLTYHQYVSTNNEALFNDEFLVWRYGPVNLTTYNMFKSYGSDIIQPKTEALIDNQSIRETIDQVLDEFGHISAWGLVDITHSEEGLWYEKMQQNQNSIDFKDFKDFNFKGFKENFEY